MVDDGRGCGGFVPAGMHRLGHRQRPIVVAETVVPFLVFAAGIAIGADWVPWH